MRALMMDTPLPISGLLEHAASVHGERELVSCSTDEPLHRSCYAQAANRARRLAKVLRRLGVGPGDRVATLAWSTHRHLEIVYPVFGHRRRVPHRQSPAATRTVAWMLDHAEDRLVFVDLAFVAMPRRRSPRSGAPTGGGNDGPRAHAVRRQERPPPRRADPTRRCWQGEREDRSPGRGSTRTRRRCCATRRGTTGTPRGVLYSHPLQVLHAFAVALPDVGGFSEADTVLPAAPMFHVSAWGIPYAAALTGARLVLPGPRLHPAALVELIQGEGVTIALGVPTVWIGLIRYLRASAQRPGRLKRVIIGGAAAPQSLIDTFQQEFGIEVRHAWGMTETSPLGTIATLKAKHDEAPAVERRRLQAKQGWPVYGVEIEVVDDNGRPLPHDGSSIGEIKVRGLWVCSGYYRADPSPATNAEAWFATGDVGTIDADGYLQITDRKKDLIKHAGEWISSVEIESSGHGASGGDPGGGDRRPRREMGRAARPDRRAAAGKQRLRA